ncbi:unnamed protein product [Rotaria sp. Silwood2]|nr:unnamed protein product [Rotaria sp. Silwood2]CAF2495005.1 unnamed protein product [Rotaria sp. Silwood2]CAF2724637.1 unnamed protein product [Rotaria sp. Silwood2]CAF2877292.1 unnamed protein product [Rotaria sp. Silwood2]CAF4005326.1 unnamed protein product [Rotaria sp. Silwood2]
MSTIDLIDAAELSEHGSIDNEQDQFVDHYERDLSVDYTEKKEAQHEQYQFDVIVIGSGPGGGAIRCAQLGKSVAIVERDLLGGHAVNWGCIPLNAMIASARIIRSIHESVRYGIDISSHRIDFLRIARHRDEAVKKSRSQIKSFLEKYHIQVYTGVANIIDKNHIRIKPIQKYTYANVYNADGGNPYETDDYVPIRTDVEISGKNIIIASGVEYELPNFVEAYDIKTVDPTRLLWHKNIPDSLIIVGGGVLGCEFASLYRHLRSNIVLIEKNSRLLKFMDEQVSFAVETRLKDIGVDIILNAHVERVSKGEVIVQLQQTNTKRTVFGSLVVICTGRKPTFNYENLQNLGIAIDQERSTIIIDENTCQTSIPTIYACGGVVSSCWSWIPCAIHQGHLAANAISEKILNEYKDNNKSHIPINLVTPFVVNVIPAVASAGEVPKLTDDVLIYTFKFQSNRRAIIDDQTWGFIKMWTTREEPKKFLAVQLVHEAAAEIIEYYSMIISLSKQLSKSNKNSSLLFFIVKSIFSLHSDIPLREVCRLPFAHPTYTESVKEACEYVLDQSMSYEGTYLN